jgi:XXXCH domain-containing protein
MGKNYESISYKNEISAQDYVRFCAGLTSWLQGEPSILDENVGADPFSQVKITLERDNNGMTLKMKVKRPRAIVAAAPEEKKDIPKPKNRNSGRNYNRLKKQMKESYQLLKQARDEGHLPREADINLFLSQSDEMVSYPDKGEPLYAPYIKACNNLRSAYESKSQTAYNAALEKIDGLKKQAHHQYK